MKEYTVTINGLEHTVLLDEDDAARVNAQPVRSKQAGAPLNKARTAVRKA